jgi:signal transduction histidine kinase
MSTRWRAGVAWTVTLWAAVVVGSVTWVAWRYNGAPVGLGLNDSVGLVATGVMWTMSGAVLITYRPRNVLGWLLLAVGACQALFVGLQVYSWYGIVIAEPDWPLARWALFLSAGLFVPAWVAFPTLLIAFYPDGRLPARWMRWPVGGAAAGILLAVLCTRFERSLYEDAWVSPPFVLPTEVMKVLIVWIGNPLLLASAAAIWVGGVVRFVRARSPQREQLAWLACVVAPSFAVGFYDPLNLFGVIALLVPVAIAVGVLRYGLLGIAAVLRRGLVYAVLTAAAVVVYLVVSALAVQTMGKTPIPGVVAAALVTVGLTPARDRLQRGVDRFIYGRRADPAQALGHLGDQVAEADEAELLHTALTSVAESVGAAGAAVVTSDGHIVSSVGTGPAGYQIGSLRLGGRDLGTLQLATRYRPPQALSVAERHLHAALTAQIAVVMLAVNLTDELKAERDRVVTATRTERDRLRRDLHDGLGPSLSGVALGLQALTDAIETNNTPACTPLLQRISAEVATAVRDIRRIIEDLRPAALDRHSLTDAVSRHAATLSGQTTVTVTTDARLRLLPPNVETAAYRIVTEALTNAARHAHARHVDVTITTDDQDLRLTVADDGGGGADTGAPGVGITSMRRRTEALHGSCIIDSAAHGTTITATLPLDQP